MIVIGTAGHIDHGKSSVVRHLTGTDPDRLPEEKKRGMTIDLGFAFYKTPDNETIAFVDVPGHERFVKNMISGAGGIDAVMLIIAADDGWMPQTEEHFQIVRLLGVKHGIIVINKSDLVDAKTIDALKDEINSRVKSTFLADAPVFEVSSVSGNGFNELSDYLDSIKNRVTSARDIGKPRLYIDRVFVRQGIGAVVTGTLKDGTLSSGQTVTIWPSQKQTKVKSLQSNSEDVTTAQPGQRTAVSFSGISKEKLKRGHVITTRDDLQYLQSQNVLAVKIELLKNSPVSLANRRKVLLLIGTTESEAEIRLLDGNELRPGNSGVIFIKPDEPVYSMIGDHIILRLPTPMVTIGGGVVLDHLSQFPKKKDLPLYSYLDSRNVYSLENLLSNELNNNILANPKELLSFSTYSAEQIANCVKELVDSGQWGYVEDFVVDIKMAAETTNQLLAKLTTLSTESNKTDGWTLSEITKFSGINSDKLKVFLSLLLREKKLEASDDKYFLPGTREKIPPEIEKEVKRIYSVLGDSKFAPPSIESLVGKNKSAKEAVRLLLQNNKVHKCGSEFLFTQEFWNDIVKFIKQTIVKKYELKVGELRDKFEITRKHAIPILEETDRLRITKRNGDVRIKGSNFES